MAQPPAIERVTLSCYDWASEKGKGEDPSFIRGWGFNDKGENVTIRFPYKVTCYIELPTLMAGRVFTEWGEYYKEVIKVINSKIKPHYISEYSLEWKKGIYYLSEENRPFIKIRLRNHEPVYFINKVCENVIVVPIPEDAAITVRLHEADIDHRRRFLTEAGIQHTFAKRSYELVAEEIARIHKEKYNVDKITQYDDSGTPIIDKTDPVFVEVISNAEFMKNVQDEGRAYANKNSGLAYCQWFRINGTPVLQHQKLTSIKNEFTISESQLSGIIPLPDTISNTWSTAVRPKILSYDIEQYSYNHKRLPRSFETTDSVFIITVVVQILGKAETRTRYSIVYAPELVGYEHLVKLERDCKLILCTTETELEHRYEDIIRAEDPDAIIGYNIYGYDNRVLSERKEAENRKWGNAGRSIYGITEKIVRKWKSSAYGFVENNIIKMDGRISYDVFNIVKRDFKFPKYDLDTVSKIFLGRGKHDVKARRMFELRENLTAARALLGADYPLAYTKVLNVEMTDTVCEAILRALAEIMKSGISIRSYTTTITQSQRNAIFEYAVREYNKLLNYAIEDSELTIDLFEKLNVWYASREFSNVSGISIEDLYTRGQQISGYSIIYDLASREGFVIVREKFARIPYKGAIVQHPIPGLYRNIICLDFASLYPTIIMAHNLCWSTYIRKEDWAKYPERFCHIFHWKETVEEETEDEETELSGVTKAKKKKKEIEVEHNHRFLRKEYKDENGKIHTNVYNEITGTNMQLKEGILPRAINGFVTKRKFVNKELIPKEKDPIIKEILDKRQLALKVRANSMYGFTGAQEGGLLPFVYIAAITTYIGRISITRVNEYVMKGHKYTDNKEYKGKVVYGDTDSTMVDFNIENPADTVPFGKHLATTITNLLFADMKPMTIEFEKAMRVMLSIAPKKYCSIYIDDEGNPKIFSGGFLGSNIDLRDDSGKEYTKYTDAYKAMQMGANLYDHSGNKVDYNTAINPFDSKNSDKLVKYLPKFVKFYEEDGSPVWFSENPKNIYSKVYYYKDTIKDMGAKTSVLKYAIESGTIYTKGVILARRDGCDYQLQAYRELMVYIMVKGLRSDAAWRTDMTNKINLMKGYLTGSLTKDNIYFKDYKKMVDSSIGYYKEGCKIIDRYLINLLHGQVNIKNLFFIKQMGGNYASESYFMRIFGDELKRDGKPVAAGDRIEYIIVKQKEESKQKLGYKVKTPEQYYESLETNEPYQIDTEYYIQKVLKNCLEQLIQVGFQEELELQTEYNRVLGKEPKYKGKIAKPVVISKLYPEGYRKVLTKMLNHSVSYDDEPIKSVSKHLEYRSEVLKGIFANEGRLPSVERVRREDIAYKSQLRKTLEASYQQGWSIQLNARANQEAMVNFQQSFQQYTTQNPYWSQDLSTRYA